MANQSAELSNVFYALADPTRRAILGTLGRGPESVSKLAAPYAMALPSFMKHLSVLERSGVIRSTKVGRVRTCELVPRTLSHAERWIAEQRATWEARSDRMAAFVENLHQETCPVPNEPVADADPRDLVITRLVRAPRATLWRAWTEPELLKQWWCPKPWTTEVRAFDHRPGGAFHTYKQGPDGGSSDNPGCFLEIVPQARIVFTTLLASGWRPGTPWLPLTATIAMADEAGGTRYIATVMHPDKATRDRHDEMGFFQGWNTCIDQLEAFAKQLG